MGTNLEATIAELEDQIRYYIACCNPSNDEEIKNKLEELIKTLKGE